MTKCLTYWKVVPQYLQISSLGGEGRNISRKTTRGEGREKDEKDEKDEKIMRRGWEWEEVPLACALCKSPCEHETVSFFFLFKRYSLWVLYCIWIWGPHQMETSSDYDLWWDEGKNWPQVPLLLLSRATPQGTIPSSPFMSLRPSSTILSSLHHAASRSLTQHHAALTQHYAASHSTHAAPRSTTQHYAALRSTTQQNATARNTRSTTQLHPYVTHPTPLSAILLHNSLVHQFWKIVNPHDQNKVTATQGMRRRGGWGGRGREYEGDIFTDFLI